jgi:hypothetical protein
VRIFFFPNLTNSRAGVVCLWLLGAGAARKKMPKAGAKAACEKKNYMYFFQAVEGEN